MLLTKLRLVEHKMTDLPKERLDKPHVFKVSGIGSAKHASSKMLFLHLRLLATKAIHLINYYYYLINYYSLYE